MMQPPEPTLLPITQKFAALNPLDFRSTIDTIWRAAQAIVDEVASQVENAAITPVQGAAIGACVTGQLFGYQEFHREVRPSDLALLVGVEGDGGGR